VRIIYEPIEGTDYPWIEEEIKKVLHWAEDAEVSPEFFCRVQKDLSAVWERLAVALINCKTPVYGFKAMVTNSALTVYPQV
jgi:hypothetical protein